MENNESNKSTIQYKKIIWILKKKNMGLIDVLQS